MEKEEAGSEDPAYKFPSPDDGKRKAGSEDPAYEFPSPDDGKRKGRV
jgi:hypothetical protein